MKKIILIPLLIFLTYSVNVGAEVVLIGNGDITRLSSGVIKRIYTGRVIELKGNLITPLNAAPYSPLRKQFLKKYLHQDEDKYLAYWTVRRFIGKGTPPKELSSQAAIIKFVQNNKGAIGYIDRSGISIPDNVVVIATE